MSPQAVFAASVAASALLAAAAVLVLARPFRRVAAELCGSPSGRAAAGSGERLAAFWARAVGLATVLSATVGAALPDGALRGAGGPPATQALLTQAALQAACGLAGGLAGALAVAALLFAFIRAFERRERAAGAPVPSRGKR